MSKKKIFGIFTMIILFVFCLQITGIVFAEDCQNSGGLDTSSSAGNAEYRIGWAFECLDITPTINDNDADDVIASAGSVNLWVDSDGLACPPYTWSVSGEGWSLNSSKTDNDLETVTLNLINTTGKTCGTDGSGNYDVYATVTVTDTCGKTDDILMKYSGGKWVNELEICMQYMGDPSIIYSGANGKYRYWAGISTSGTRSCIEQCFPNYLLLNDYFKANNWNFWCDPAHDHAMLTNLSTKVNHHVGLSNHLYRQIWSCP